MKRHSLLLASAFAATTLGAATVESVTYRQQWPWSTDIKVSYTLSDVTAPVDATIRFFDGETELSYDAKGIEGERYGLAADGTYAFTVRAQKAFGTTRTAYGDFKVRVTVAEAPANRTEVLYKIFDLTSGGCENVTRADLLNDKYGDYVTSYAAIGTGFTTTLDDVLIWTGVTNDIAYKTTKLVMRKIDAKDRVWLSGDPAGTYSTSACVLRTQYWNKFTYDYYIAVFETTLAQWKAVYGAYPSNSVSADGDTEKTSAANVVYRNTVVGDPAAGTVATKGYVTGEKICFPTNSYVRDVSKESFAGKMWKLTGCEFTLPTVAEWEYACMGGNTTPLYSALDQALTANITALAWTSYNSGNSIHRVGELKCNAYGLYDMLGNVMERVLGVGSLNEGGESGTGESASDPVVNPLGKLETTSTTDPYYCGGCWSSAISDYGNVNAARHAGRHSGWVEYYSARTYIGFRLVMPARSDGQWADHP